MPMPNLVSTLRKTMNPEPYAFAKRLLEPLDDYLRHNLHQLTCKDIRALYEGLFDSQKVYRGTSTGITGFSEFLVLRPLVHLLGVERNVSTDEGRHTHSFWKGSMRVSQGALVTTTEGKIRPDILLEEKDVPVAAAEIKTIFTDRKKLQDAFERLKGPKAASNKQFKGAIIVYINEDNYLTPKLEEDVAVLGHENRDWLEILNLKTDDRLFKDALTKALGLERFEIQESVKRGS
jgi:hypothetical protein